MRSACLSLTLCASHVLPGYMAGGRAMWATVKARTSSPASPLRRYRPTVPSIWGVLREAMARPSEDVKGWMS